MNASVPDPEQTRALAERALRGSTGEVELFAFAAAERSLQLVPGTADTVEAVGARTTWTARAWRDGKAGVAAGAPGTDEELRALIGTAIAQAEAGRPSPRPPATPGAVSPGAPELPPLARSRQQLFDLCAPLPDRPGVVQAAVVREVAGHRGLFSTFSPPVIQALSSTRALLRYDLPLGALVDGASAEGAASLDLAALHRRLLDAADTLAERGGDPDPALPFCFLPLAAAPLLDGLAWLLRGDVGGRTSGLAKAVGKRVFPATLTVEDAPPGASATFDDEGAPARPLTLVDQGRLQHFLHSAETAAELAGSTAGRAVRTGGRGAPAPAAMGLVIRGSAAPLPPDCNELCARLETFVSMARPGKVLIRAAGWVRKGGVRVRRLGPMELELPVVESLRLLTQVSGTPEPLPATGPFAAPALVLGSLPAGGRA